MKNLQNFETVITPGGVGRLCAIDNGKDTALVEMDYTLVEMDYTYLVEYPLSEVKSYEVPVQEKA